MGRGGLRWEEAGHTVAGRTHSRLSSFFAIKAESMLESLTWSNACYPFQSRKLSICIQNPTGCRAELMV